MAARESAFWQTHEPRLRQLVGAQAGQGVNWGAVAAQIPGATPDACRFKWKSMAFTPTTSSASTTFTDTTNPPTLSAAPFAVPYPAVAEVTDPRGMVALAYGDSHMGMEDERALACVLGIAHAAQPDIVVHMGDLLDAYFLSRFDKNPDHASRIQDEIDAARSHLHHVAQIVPRARRVLLEGNHEARLEKAIWGMPGTASEIGRLTAFRQAMTWPSLLGTDQVGWEWIPTAKQSRTPVLPGFITKHGSVVRKWSGQSGKGEWEKYGTTGISGHVHRLGTFYHRDANGAHVWVETGCTCSLEPDYCQDPNWQQGCAVITWDDAGERFNVEPIYIQDGRAVWRGRTVRA